MPHALSTEPPKPQPTTPPTNQQEDAVQAHIDGNKVAIFSKTYCPYCSRAKALFSDTLKVPAGVVELDALGGEGAAIQQALQARTGIRTVPQVFVSGKLVGGCDGGFGWVVGWFGGGGMEKKKKKGGTPRRRRRRRRRAHTRRSLPENQKPTKKQQTPSPRTSPAS